MYPDTAQRNGKITDKKFLNKADILVIKMKKELFQAWAIFLIVFIFVVFFLSKYMFKAITTAATWID